AWSRDERPWDEILAPGVDYASLAEPVPGRAGFKVHIGDLYPSLLNAPYVAVQTLLVRRLEAGGAPRFAEDLRTWEDLEWVARLARTGKAAYIDAETAWQWSHAGPRLTDADELVTAISHLKLIERLWGADEAFMAEHGDRVRRLVRTLRLR